MNEPASRHSGTPRSSTTVTVAELVARITGTAPPGAIPAQRDVYAAAVPADGAAQDAAEPGAESDDDPEGDPPDAGPPDAAPPRPAGPTAISVAALLRREGRGPHRMARPLIPRGHSVPPAPPPRHRLRKASAAAGALFAAGAVFGSVLVDDAVRHPSGPGSDPPADEPGLDEAPEALRTSGAAAKHRVAPGPVTGLTLASVASPVADTVPSPTTGAPAASEKRLFLSGLQPAPGDTGAPDTGGTPGSATGGDGQESSGPGTGSAGPGAGGPGGGGPGGGGPGRGSPKVDGPVGDGHGGGGAPVLAPDLPEAATPAVRMPGAAADVPVVRQVRSPALAASAGRVTPPQAQLTVSDGTAELVTSEAAVQTPDLGVSERTSGAEVAVPNVEVSAARIALSADGPPEVELPRVEVSGAEITTPDVRLGDTEVALPDLELAEVHILTTREAAEETVGTDGHDGSREGDDTEREPARSVGEAAVRALDQP